MIDEGLIETKTKIVLMIGIVQLVPENLRA